MFARTKRLLLRPGFAEDSAQLMAAIGDEGVVRNLARAPWPYGEAEARTYLASMDDQALPSLLMFERTGGAPRLVGGCGLARKPSGRVVLGYWVARSDWGRGLATEACAALVEIARSLRLPAIEAAHFIDNPASGRVLEKLGFQPTGVSAPMACCARGTEVMARLFRLELGDAREEALAA